MNKSSPYRIAVVDDDPSVVRALKRLLRSRAMDVETYGSAQEFLASLPEHLPLPGCLVVDLQMPGMTGLELHEHLVSLGLRIPAIIITAHGGPKMRERCELAGTAAFLTKPLREDTLVAAINAARDSSESNHRSVS